MKKNKGFALVEMIVIAVIIIMLIAIVAPWLESKRGNNTTNSISTSQKIQGQPSTNCAHGYAVLLNGNQMIDENGKGVRC